MLTNALKAVAEFHKAGGAPVRWGPFNGNPDIEEMKLRRRLIKEEAKELTGALSEYITSVTAAEAMVKVGDLDGLQELAKGMETDNPLIAILDGLCDLTYVVLGTALSFGFDLDSAFAEVHRSNMTKFPTTLREDGKVLKGPNYEAPNLAQVLSNQVMNALLGGKAPWDEEDAPELEELFSNGYAASAVSDFVDELQDDGATPEEVVEILGEYGIEARVEHNPGCGHDHGQGNPVDLDSALRELFSGADEHIAEAHAAAPRDGQSITDFLRDAGFTPELGVAG